MRNLGGWRLHSGTLLLARNTAWIGVGQLIRVAAQAGYFVLIARALGARDYGEYVSVLALVAIVAPFATLGSGNLLIQEVSRAPETFRLQWGRTLVTTILIGSVLLIVLSLGAKLVISKSASIELVLAIGAADLIFVRLLDISGQAYQAVQRLHRTAQLQLLLSALRLVGSVGLVLMVAKSTPLVWGVLYLGSAAVGSAFALFLVGRELGQPKFRLQALYRDWWESLPFSLGLSAQSWNDNLDKAMLARLATLEVTGVYGAAFRVVQVAFVPVDALMAAAYARFFQHGVQGIRATARFAGRLLSLGACYGFVAAAGLYLIAPVLPTILGDEYYNAVTVLRWLALLPLLKAVQHFGSDALTGAGYVRVRTLAQIGVGAVNLFLNVRLIPKYSWRGAAVASIASDVLLALVFWGIVWYLGWYSRRESSKQSTTVVQGV
jgi:O-antigen/teichoic acid export membrane protein